MHGIALPCSTTDALPFSVQQAEALLVAMPPPRPTSAVINVTVGKRLESLMIMMALFSEADTYFSRGK